MISSHTDRHGICQAGARVDGDGNIADPATAAVAEFAFCVVSPTEDAPIRPYRARGLGARGQRHDIGKAGARVDPEGDVDPDEVAAHTELTLSIATKTKNAAASLQETCMSLAGCRGHGIQRGIRVKKKPDIHWDIAEAACRLVPELAEGVVTPTPHRAVGEDNAGVLMMSREPRGRISARRDPEGRGSF